MRLRRLPHMKTTTRSRLREFWLWTKISAMLAIAPVLGGLYCAHAMGA